MRHARLYTVLILILVLIGVPVYGESAINVSVNGASLQTSQPPVIVEGRTLVPLRAIFEALGVTPTWDGNTRTVTAKSGNVEMSLPIGSNTATVNGKSASLDVPGTIVNGSTMVPARFIAETFGAEVSWDAATRTVKINSVAVDWVTQTINNLGYASNTVLVVDGGNTSGLRKANVKVDVGFGSREYWAFTNTCGQLVAVISENVVLQDNKTEPVDSNGRYYPDEAKVPGTEAENYDEGHVIADSLGGVSNAYNITPQESTLNRHGDQAYMEKMIRDAGGCKHFVAIISYPNTQTQIPNHYSYTYVLKGNAVNDEFDNVNPDGNTTTPTTTQSTDSTVAKSSAQVKITKLDKVAEYVIITNTGTVDVDIANWVLVSEKGDQRFTFPSGIILKAGASFTLTSGSLAGTGDFTMAKGTIWNNSEADPAALYDANGTEVDRKLN